MAQYEREEYRVSFFENLKLSAWIFRRIKPYWKAMTLSIFFMIMISLVSLIPPVLTKNAINLYLSPTKYSIAAVPSMGSITIDGVSFVPSASGKYTVKTDGTLTTISGNGKTYSVKTSEFDSIRVGGIVTIALEIFAIFAVVFFASYAQTYLSQSVGIRTVNDVRNELFDHVVKQPMRFFDSNVSGRLVTRVTNDTQNLNDMFSMMLSSIFKDMVLIIGIIYMLFSMNLKLFLITVPVFLIVMIMSYVFRFFSRRIFRIVRAKIAAINAFLAEHISGMIVTFLFNRKSEKSGEFYAINNDYYRATIKQLLVFAVFRPMISFMNYSATALLIWFGARAVIGNEMEIGTLFAFITYIGMAFNPINDMAQNFSNMQSSLVSVERIRALLKMPIPENPVSDAKIEDGSVEMKNVWFSYDEKTWILKDLSIKMNNGDRIAIVGHTGAGKSTISSILTGLYPYSKGKVRIGGTEVSECPFGELRAKVNIVLQEVMLFSGTVLENITLWDERITRDTVLGAVKNLNLEGFISSLENGIDTHVREGGNNLSTGQRQLISIIRAFVRQPEVVIMDEATSNVDVETESMIQHASEALMEGRTTIMIAHRLSTIRNVDRIIVLNYGEIAEEGNHEELMSKDGVYAKLYRLQSFEEYRAS